MDEVLQFAKELLKEVSTEYSPESISIIAAAVFEDKMTVVRIAFFMAYIQKLIENCPDKKHDIYEKTFISICRNIKF